jgi:hypothetical protein
MWGLTHVVSKEGKLDGITIGQMPVVAGILGMLLLGRGHQRASSSAQFSSQFSSQFSFVTVSFVAFQPTISSVRSHSKPNLLERNRKPKLKLKMKRKMIMALTLLGLHAANVAFGCAGYHTVKCHTGSSWSCSAQNSCWCNYSGNLAICTVTATGTCSSTDGPNGLECDDNGGLDYCNGDSIPGACTYSETLLMPDFFGCGFHYSTYNRTGDIPYVNAGGTCGG